MSVPTPQAFETRSIGCVFAVALCGAVRLRDAVVDELLHHDLRALLGQLEMIALNVIQGRPRHESLFNSSR
jgi:hypothetical protein